MVLSHISGSLLPLVIPDNSKNDRHSFLFAMLNGMKNFAMIIAVRSPAYRRGFPIFFFSRFIFSR
jgi:hypothetical protein